MPHLMLNHLANALHEFAKELGIDINIITKLPDVKIKDERLQITKSEREHNEYCGRYYFREDGDEFYIPHADYTGIYFFFNKEDEALYVGKAEDTIGKRVADHMSDYEEAEYVVTIPFKKSYLAPALESYLLSKYAFKDNSQLNRAKH